MVKYLFYVQSLWLSLSARCARTIAPCSLCDRSAISLSRVARARRLLILVVRLVCDILCAAQQAVRYVVDLVLTKMVKVWGVLEFYFLEW